MSSSYPTTERTERGPWHFAALAGLAGRMLPDLRAGVLRVRLPSGEVLERAGSESGPEVFVDVHRWRTFARLIWNGDVGFAGSYGDGDWSTPDIAALLRLLIDNEDGFKSTTHPTRFARFARRLHHLTRRNTRAGSKRNISEHYDLGNRFYAAWLDRDMSYSSAIYQDPRQSLEEAQHEKLVRIAELLELAGGERVLEIGCGWGALASHLIGRHECEVRGLTLSSEQLAYARSRLRNDGLSGSADMRLLDYRDATGTYDRIVSIEMIEAVGESYWPVYFRTLRERLREGGLAVLQVITIAEERFAAYRDRPDFIQRFIFPGGMLPTDRLVHEHARRAGLTPVAQESFGDSYARTLEEWRRRFLEAWPRLAEQGFDERFRRLWEYYLAYCETGFRTGRTDVTLYKFARA